MVEIDRFPSGVYVLHGKAVEGEILAHHAPHDTEFRRPAS
jgi:hypothetical protein